MPRRSRSMSRRSRPREAQVSLRGVGVRVARPRLVGALVAAWLLGGVMAADAGAAVGDLAQKPGGAGCLSAIGVCSPAVALDGAWAVTVSADAKSAYVASHESDAVAVLDRAADGALTQKPGTAGCISQTGGGGCSAAGHSTAPPR